LASHWTYSLEIVLLGTYCLETCFAETCSRVELVAPVIDLLLVSNVEIFGGNSLLAFLLLMLREPALSGPDHDDDDDAPLGSF